MQDNVRIGIAIAIAFVEGAIAYAAYLAICTRSFAKWKDNRRRFQTEIRIPFVTGCVVGAIHALYHIGIWGLSALVVMMMAANAARVAGRKSS